MKPLLALFALAAAIVTMALGSLAAPASAHTGHAKCGAPVTYKTLAGIHRITYYKVQKCLFGDGHYTTYYYTTTVYL